MVHPVNLATDRSYLQQSDALAQSYPKLHSVSEIVIPARLASSRLPEKLLLSETGKSVLQHTFEAATKASRPSGITVAVDSQRLQQAVAGFGGQAFLTDPELPSGTDRVVEVARHKPQVDIFVNVQGDEPEIDPDAIDKVVGLLEQDPTIDVATLATPIRSWKQVNDPACVKVVCDCDGHALYFSRSPIPHIRDSGAAASGIEWFHQSPPAFWQHLGIYAYRRNFLLNLKNLPYSPLEQLEKLEQLRFLQAGCKIKVGQVPHATRGIDTPDYYREFVQRYLCR